MINLQLINENQGKWSSLQIMNNNTTKIEEHFNSIENVFDVSSGVVSNIQNMVVNNGTGTTTSVLISSNGIVEGKGGLKTNGTVSGKSVNVIGTASGSDAIKTNSGNITLGDGNSVNTISGKTKVNGLLLESVVKIDNATKPGVDTGSIQNNIRIINPSLATNIMLTDDQVGYVDGDLTTFSVTSNADNGQRLRLIFNILDGEGVPPTLTLKNTNILIDSDIVIDRKYQVIELLFTGISWIWLNNTL